MIRKRYLDRLQPEMLDAERKVLHRLEETYANALKALQQGYDDGHLCRELAQKLQNTQTQIKCFNLYLKMRGVTLLSHQHI